MFYGRVEKSINLQSVIALVCQLKGLEVVMPTFFLSTVPA